MTEALDFLECCLFFNHTIFRGNRVSKASSNDFNAFSSPNFPPLVNGVYHNLERRRAEWLILLDSWDRHSGELERSHPTNKPS